VTKPSLNLSLLWSAITGTVVAMLWITTNFASASDVERIEYTLLKQEIRSIRRELRDHDSDDRIKQYLEDDLQKAIDALCRIEPKDRECST